MTSQSQQTQQASMMTTNNNNDSSTPADDFSDSAASTSLAKKSSSSSPSLYRTTSDLSSNSNPFTAPGKEVPVVISWSETLKSPTLASFSPAEPNSKHGLAMQMALERSKALAKTNKRCAALLTDLCGLYDTYATSLIKVATGLPPPVTALQESALQMSGETSKMSATLKNVITQPLQTYHTTHIDAVTGIAQRYQQSRQAASVVRQRALNARNQYLRASAVTGTEASVGEESNATLTDSANKKTSKQLADVQKFQAKYERLVKYENECVKQSQRIESMALDTLQKMEEDRLVIFVRGLVQTLQAHRVTLEETVVSLNLKYDDVTESNESSSESRISGTKRFLFPRRNSIETEAAGVMDAETLGLPTEMGALRDKVRSQLAARRERLQATKTLALFLENVAKTCVKLGLTTVSSLQKTASSNDPLHVSMASCEGARVLRLWDCLVSFLEHEAEDHVKLSEQLRALRGSKLDPIILNGDRSVKAATESDDASWKQLCEAARAQSRAETRYRQSTADTAKARERLNSEGQGSKDSLNVGQHFGAGLAKMLELMPAGGENAMKIMPAGARATFAQRSMDEADQREIKGRQHFDTAREVTTLALDAYKTNANKLLAKFGEEESRGWDSIKETMEEFICQVKTCRKEHLDILIEKQGIIEQLRDDAWFDLNEWRIMAQQELVSKCVETDSESGAPDSGFQLEFRLELDGYKEGEDGVDDTGNMSLDTSVDKGLQEEDEDDDFDDDAEEENDEVTAISETSKHGGSLESLEESNIHKFFTRSFSAPPNLRTKLDLRGKLRRGRLRSVSDHEDFETELFLTYFWPELVDAKKVTTIVDSFACSFRDGGQKIPFQYGRVYLTPNRILFTSWSKKKLNLYWQEVSQVKPSRGFHGLRNDTVHVICRKKDSGDFSCMTLGGFYDRVSVLEKIEKLREDARIEAEKQAAADALAKAKTAAVPASLSSGEGIDDQTMIVDRSPDGTAVPPDEKMSTMTVVVSKVIHGISVQTFYDVVWAEKEKPLYKPWLEQSAFDIDLEDWKQGQVIGSWCKEQYDMSRRAKFKVKRTTHLYIGPPIANVLQTHRVRLEGSDKCVASMTIEFEGIPYSDCFAVEVRYVATRQGNDIKYECGLLVDFRKSTFLKRQIQAGTIEESTPVYRNFFKVVHAACLEAQGGDAAEAAAEAAAEEEEEPVAAEKPVGGFQAILVELQSNSLVVGAVGFLIFSILLRRMFASKALPDPISDSPNLHFEMDLIIGRMDKLEDQMSRLQNTLDEIVSLLKERSES